MGLLSDSERRRKLITFLERWKNILSVIGYIGGVIWLLLLASDEFNSSAYISENALLPGLVETSFSEDSMAFKFYQELKDICTKDVYTQRDWIIKKMVREGLEVFYQNFSYADQGLYGQNIYGILRSPRSSGVESLVLNVPQSYGCNSNAALAVMFSVIRHFKFQNYWAKDIMFLVTEHDSCGVEAWLSSYHGGKLKGIVASDLKGHAGKIQAVLAIDLTHSSIHGMDVLFEGINGLLPNLDLLHLVFRVGRSEGVPIKLHNQDSYYGFVDKFEEFKRCLQSLYKMILVQATGAPSGVHGHYLKYRIEAVTLKEATTGERDKNAHFSQIGKTVEGIFRSFNNLQEHFHQSFFMYLLPASERYISIALYMPVLGGILVGPLLHAVSLWMQTLGKDIEKDATNRELLSADTIWHTAIMFLLSHSVGALLYLALPHIVAHGKTESGVLTEVAVGSWLVTFTLGYLYPARNGDQLKILKFIIVLYTTAIVSMTSLLNFSLALLIALPLVPLVLFVDVSQNSTRIIANLKYAIVLFLSPVTCVVLLSAFQSFASGGSTDARTLIGQSIKKADSLLFYALSKPYMNMWTWELLSLVVLPIWVLISSMAYPY